ncbi:hypothetical protein BDZ91DRAFT_764900 [Kalaharituber pfeilii]|nr:hypothetical protein BDZ91DRAFT_764900 [Kalaharituber pfeilii]
MQPTVRPLPFLGDTSALQHGCREFVEQAADMNSKWTPINGQGFDRSLLDERSYEQWNKQQTAGCTAASQMCQTTPPVCNGVKSSSLPLLDRTSDEQHTVPTPSEEIVTRSSSQSAVKPHSPRFNATFPTKILPVTENLLQPNQLQPTPLQRQSFYFETEPLPSYLLPGIEPSFERPSLFYAASRAENSSDSRKIDMDAIPRTLHGELQLSLVDVKLKEKPAASSGAESIHTSQVRLPPISTFFSLALPCADSCSRRKDHITNHNNYHSPMDVILPPLDRQTLPLPQPVSAISPAGYYLPAGIAPPRRRTYSPLVAQLQDAMRASTQRQAIAKRHSLDSTRDFQGYPQTPPLQQDNKFSDLPPRVRQICRRTMSEREKRARKAAQQQRRRKYGPMRDARERFSRAEDLWLVTEKRRLEKEPNKHWTDLETAHKTTFPNKTFRTLSGLQSRYYRIKEKFEHILDTNENGQRLGREVGMQLEQKGPSKWDEAVQGHFDVCGDTDGEKDLSDDNMLDACTEDGSCGSGEEKLLIGRPSGGIQLRRRTCLDWVLQSLALSGEGFWVMSESSQCYLSDTSRCSGLQGHVPTKVQSTMSQQLYQVALLTKSRKPLVSKFGFDSASSVAV